MTVHAPERTYTAFPFTTHTSIVLVVLRDPDASNTFTAFGRDIISTFGVSMQGDLFIHDIDAGGMDLRDHGEYHEWSEHHLGTAVTLRAAGWALAADHIEETVAGYEPHGYDPLEYLDEEDEEEDDGDPLTDEERERRDVMNLAMENNPDLAFTASDMEDY